MPSVLLRPLDVYKRQADIHFVPEVAAIAAKYVDKVRINPGNYNSSHGEFGIL